MKRVIASLDVDPQNGFTAIANELVVPEGEMIVPELLRNHDLATLKAVSRDWHPPAPIWEAKTEEEQFTEVSGKDVDLRWKLHCVAGTLGSELLDGLPKPIDYDYVVSKGLDPDVHPYGAVYHDLAETKTTGLKEFFAANGVTTVIVGGLATDYCVLTTIKQLVDCGFEVVVNKAACRGVAVETTEKALSEISEICTLCENAEAMKEYLG